MVQYTPSSQHFMIHVHVHVRYVISQHLLTPFHNHHLLCKTGDCICQSIVCALTIKVYLPKNRNAQYTTSVPNTCINVTYVFSSRPFCYAQLHKSNTQFHSQAEFSSKSAFQSLFPCYSCSNCADHK